MFNVFPLGHVELVINVSWELRLKFLSTVGKKLKKCNGERETPENRTDNFVTIRSRPNHLRRSDRDKHLSFPSGLPSTPEARVNTAQEHSKCPMEADARKRNSNVFLVNNLCTHPCHSDSAQHLEGRLGPGMDIMEGTSDQGTLPASRWRGTKEEEAETCGRRRVILKFGHSEILTHIQPP